MLRMVSRRSALFSLIIASALAAPSLAGDTVPLKGQGSFTPTGQTVDPSTGNFIISANVAGNLSHLGQFTGTATQVSFAPDYVSFTVDLILVAANGDQLFATFDGMFVDTQGDSVGTFEITGGTGRFAGASGTGTILSLGGDSEAHFFAQGVITTVGSAKK
jgi:hypothetical protein